MTVFNAICPDLLITDRCNMACRYCFEKNKGTNDMDLDKLNEYMNHNPCATIFPFGGETLLKMDLLCAIVDLVIKNKNLNKERRDEILKKTLSVITNGTLLTDLIIEKLKKYGFEIQISIDGPEHVQNKNRVFPDGSGSYDIIMKGINKLIENGMNWSMHGAINKETLPYVYDTSVWFFETYKEKKNIEKAIEHMGKNTFQIIFEEDYDDNDVDILIEQFYKFAQYIYSRDYLTEKQKNQLFDKFFLKCGANCAAGTVLIAIDHKFDMYPCHRVAMIPEKRDLYMGNVFKPFEMSNFRALNSYYNLSKLKKYMYSSITNNHNFKDEKKDTLRWFMWCPSTNWQTSGTVYYQNAKYNLMFTELNRAIQEIKKEFYIDLPEEIKEEDDGKGRSDNRRQC